MKLEFSDGIAVKETSWNNVAIKIVATLGAMVSINTVAFDSNHQDSKLEYNPTVDYKSISSEKLRTNTYESLPFYQDNTAVKNLSFFSESLTSVETFKVSLTAGEILSKQYTNSRINLELYSSNSGIIKTNIVKEETSMTSKILNHRENVEKFGFITGSILGFMTLALSIFSLVEWGGTIPPAVLFFSLPAFILMRKRLREESR